MEVRRLVAGDSLAELLADYSRRFTAGAHTELGPALDEVGRAAQAGQLPGFAFFKDEHLYGTLVYGHLGDGARILFLHFLDGIASRDLGLLVTRAVENIRRENGVERIISEFTYLGPGDPNPYFARLGFRALPRLVLSRSLAELPTLAEAPAGYRFLPWTPADREAIAELILLGKEGSADQELYAEFRSHEGTLGLVETLAAGGLGQALPDLTWVAREASGRVVGSTLGVLLTPEDGFVVDLTVAPDHRRRGLGAGLLSWQLAAMAEQGAVRVLLGVTAANASAVELYQRLGFTTRQRFTAQLWLRHHGVEHQEEGTACQLDRPLA